MAAYDPVKTVLSGIKGAALTGGAALGALQTVPDETIDDPEKAIISAVVALVGFAVRAFLNYMKNRHKR